MGDSPILGAGLYVDGAVGAAGSTGRGEANLYNLCSFLIVEEMRRGKSPKDAGMEALRRIKANTVEKRLLNKAGNPNFGINFYVLNARGEHAGRHDVRRREVRRLHRQGAADSSLRSAASGKADRLTHELGWRMKKKVYIAQRSRLVTLLREVRIEAGLTQMELAVRIERDQTFVSKV